MEKVPFYAIKGSPVFEHPLNLFNPDEDADILEKEYGIPNRYLGGIMSPWAVKRLHEFGGDITKFKVVKLHRIFLTRLVLPRLSLETKTIRIYPALSVRSIYVSSKNTLRMILMPTVFLAHSVVPIRV